MVGIAQYFWDSSDDSEPNKTGAEMEAAKQAKDFTLVYEQQAILKESIRSKYTFAEFVAFFKGFVLDLGQLTYDEGFLGEKRNQVYMESSYVSGSTPSLWSSNRLAMLLFAASTALQNCRCFLLIVLCHFCPVLMANRQIGVSTC